MLNCLKTPSEDSVRSKQLDKELKTITKPFQNAIKILLLGTGESGKTTIIKQMKILHINGFTESDKKDKIKEIRQNINESIYELTKHVPLLGLSFQNPAVLKASQYILNLGKTAPDILTNEYIDNILLLWSDNVIQTCYYRANEFQLIDSAKYFLDKLEIVARDDYLPTIDDILHSRKITTGIHEIKFSVKIPKSMGGGVQEFRMFDVGGQRDQRPKWLQVFEGIQAILFIISCGDFDQTLREDSKQNRLIEALELFNCVWINRFLSSAGIIVFLNKQDIMEEKIKMGKHIENYFPEFKNFNYNNYNKENNINNNNNSNNHKNINQISNNSIANEIEKTKSFIHQQLIDITAKEPNRRTSALISSDNNSRSCFYHFTVATDTNNIRKVFNDVHYMILKENLKDIGLL